MLRNRHGTEREAEPLINQNCRKFLEETRLLIDRDDLLVLDQDVIGQGNFGCVFKGLLKVKDKKQETEVAVKTLKTLTEATYTGSADARSFLEEALRMREFDHPHILRLIGIALDNDEQPLVILPFMKHGDLLTYIRDEKNSPTIKDLMDFGIQVAEGMAYLSKLKFVHRDLAARNCMLNDNLEVQVADFGLSRDIYERDYYSSDGRKAKLPVKWMALESLEKGIYNIKTDVWSYGVVLWELMTRGVTPYPEVDNWEIIKFLKPGRRMPQPSYCPNSLYTLMLQCWDPEPNNRPPFNRIVMEIQNIMYDMENRQEAQHNRCVNHIYSNVPTSQNYLYPTVLHSYTMHSNEEEGVATGGHGGYNPNEGLNTDGIFHTDMNYPSVNIGMHFPLSQDTDHMG